MTDKFKAKMRTKSFWVALIGALTLIIGSIGVEDISDTLAKIIEAVGSLLMVSGILASPAKPTEKSEEECEGNAEEKAEEENNESSEADKAEEAVNKDENGKIASDCENKD